MRYEFPDMADYASCGGLRFANPPYGVWFINYGGQRHYYSIFNVHLFTA